MTTLALMLVLAGTPVADGPLRFRATLIDLPFNTLEVPSMQQSLDVGRLTMQGVNALVDALGVELERTSGSTFLRWLVEVPLLIGWAFGQSQLPFGSTWAHEEWHRAVMTTHGVSSFNQTYWPSLSSSKSVTNVTDEALAQFKATDPAGYVRLPAAGMESQVFLTRRVLGDSFFDERRITPDLPFVLFERVNVFTYLSVCLDPGAQAAILSAELTQTQAQLDFTGWDCNAWAYDLERPTEPYSARGLRPDGQAVFRYRALNQLSPQMTGFLEAARWLSLANFLSPQLVGIASLPSLWPGVRWNFEAHHWLTAFGQELSLDVLVHSGDVKVIGSYHHGFNGAGHFPGVELELVRYPFRIAGIDGRLSANAHVFLQPRALRFDATELQPGVAGRVAMSLRVAGTVFVFAEFDAKSAGWVAGNPYLTAAMQGRGGVEVELQ